MREATLMELIASAGQAKSLAYEALDKLAAGEVAAAEECLRQADALFTRAHQLQTELLQAVVGANDGVPQRQNESCEPDTVPWLLCVHALDILMTGMTEHNLIQRIVRLFRSRCMGL
ncbi:MAG: PTS lactose/cellobiose transporter subunit IIA [Bacillota bacterium]